MGAILTKGSTEKAGDIKYVAANAIPNGWLKANGAAVNRVTYSALFAAIGTTFGAADGAVNFNLPDCRGEFIRGHDDGRGVDSGRVFGTAQAHAVASHTHGMTMGALNSTSSGCGTAGTNQRGQDAGCGVDQTAATGGAETRPRNVAMLACIKF